MPTRTEKKIVVFLQFFALLFVFAAGFNFAKAQTYSSYDACYEDKIANSTTADADCCKINPSWTQCKTSSATGSYASYSDCYNALEQVSVDPKADCCSKNPTWSQCASSGSGSSSGSSSSGQATTGGSNSGITVKCDSPLVNQNGICVPASPFGGAAGQTKLLDLVLLVIKYLLLLSGVIAVVMFVIGGFYWMTAQGNDEQAEKGQKTLTNAVIGLIVILMAYAIVSIITNTLTQSPSTSGSSVTSSSQTATKRAGVNEDGTPIQ